MRRIAMPVYDRSRTANPPAEWLGRFRCHSIVPRANRCVQGRRPEGPALGYAVIDDSGARVRGISVFGHGGERVCSLQRRLAVDW
jgi:hypothetical protein